jgi:hypothetical protein
MGRSFALLKSDRELMWLPIFFAITCLAVSVVLLSGGALLFLPGLKATAAAGGRGVPMTQGMWAWLFLFYLANYFVVVFFNVALVSAAGDRLASGHATLDQGLQVAWARKGKILQWALLAATAGILLRMLEERVSWLGRLGVSFIGVAWTLATYFVVPVLAAEDLAPVEALARSADLFRQRWGEQVAGGFSFGVIFTLLALPAAIFPLYGATLGRAAMIAGTVLAVVYWLLLGVLSAAVRGTFMAGLYRYATTGNVPVGFDRDDFAGA